MLPGKEPTRYTNRSYRQATILNTFTDEHFICQYKTRNVDANRDAISKGPLIVYLELNSCELRFNFSMITEWLSIEYSVS